MQNKEDAQHFVAVDRVEAVGGCVDAWDRPHSFKVSSEPRAAAQSR